MRVLACVMVSAIMVAVTAGCPYATTPVKSEVPLVPEVGGYTFTGSLGLEGALTYDADAGAWKLKGSFTFPTGGFTLHPVEVVVMESYPEQVRVVFRITKPGPGAMVTMALVEAPFEEQIAVSREATFTLETKETVGQTS
jgi:hypothetical protein